MGGSLRSGGPRGSRAVSTLMAVSGGAILVVEDDATTCDSLVRLLRRAGYAVIATADGEAAWALLAAGDTRPFDVVIADLLLGALDGLALAKRVGQLADPPAVVILTGWGTAHSLSEAQRLGVHAYLLKPCPPTELLASIGRAVAARPLP